MSSISLNKDCDAYVKSNSVAPSKTSIPSSTSASLAQTILFSNSKALNKSQTVLTTKRLISELCTPSELVGQLAVRFFPVVRTQLQKPDVSKYWEDYEKSSPKQSQRYTDYLYMASPVFIYENENGELCAVNVLECFIFWGNEKINKDFHTREWIPVQLSYNGISRIKCFTDLNHRIQKNVVQHLAIASPSCMQTDPLQMSLKEKEASDKEVDDLLAACVHCQETFSDKEVDELLADCTYCD